MNNDIDIIILWVDSSDPKWLTQYNNYATNKLEDNRYKDWGILKYIFRGIEKFLPWVRKIHFITCGQKPEWMINKHDKINFINHSDIYPDTNILPVFNSSSIELNFERIPDLAEKFIYFNDDMVILKPTSINRFFIDDLPVDFLIETPPRRGWLYNKIRKVDNWNNMINNSIDLINNCVIKKEFKNKKKYLFTKNYKPIHILANFIAQSSSSYIAFKHYHQPQPYLKKTIITVNNNFYSAISETIKSRFRLSSNISQAIYRYYHLVNQDFSPHYYNDHACINISSLSSAKKCIAHIKTKRFVCINDSISSTHADYNSCKTSIINELDSTLPECSSFETEYYK